MPRSPLDDLAVVPLDDLVLHEQTEPARADRVRAEIAGAGVLADPVVVTPTGSGRWLVLDGAHRTAALRSLGLSAALVQVMTLSPAGARLDSWSHDLPAGSVPRGLGGPGPVGGPALVATVQRVDDRGRWSEPVAVTGPREVAARASVTTAVASRYARAPYARVVPGTPTRPGSAARVTWTPWSVTDLLELVDAEITLPAGTTRFVLPGRVLGVRVGLDELAQLSGRMAARETPDGVHEAGTAAEPDLLARLRTRTLRTYTELVHVVEAGS